MKPFPGEFDYCAWAFGTDYCLNIADAGKTAWVANLFVGFLPWHACYDHEERAVDTELLKNCSLFYSGYRVMADGYEDHSSFWVGIQFDCLSTEDAIVQVEEYLAELAKAFPIQGEASYGCPPYLTKGE